MWESIKKSLLSCEANNINTEIVISLKNKSKHEIINVDETTFTASSMSWYSNFTFSVYETLFSQYAIGNLLPSFDQ
jgi:hypothetical protein